MRARTTFSTVSGMSTGTSRSKLQPAVRAAKRAGVDHRADQLLEVEGVALRSVEKAALELVGQRLGADQGPEQLAPDVAAERLERDLARAVRRAAEGFLAKGPCGVIPLRSQVEQQQDRRAFGELEEATRQRQRRGVGPVQVVERDRQRALGREELERLGDAIADALLGRLRRDRSPILVVRGEAKRGLERRPELVGPLRGDAAASSDSSAGRTSSALAPASHSRSSVRNGQYGSDSP